MKKWMYLISVGSMLGVFLFFYLTHLKQMDIVEKQKKEQAEVQRKKDEAEKAAREEQARKDAIRRDKERKEEERKKQEEKLAKWNADNKKIQDETAGYNAKADGYNQLISKLQVELDSLRKQKEALNREEFEISKRVETARIDRQNADFEIERVTSMISDRAEQSPLTRKPQVVTTKPSS